MDMTISLKTNNTAPFKSLLQQIDKTKLEKNLRGAVSWGRSKRVEKWLAEGADISSVALSKKNENAIHEATKNNYSSEIALKLVKEVENNPKYKGKESSIINHENINGKTPVHLAISQTRQHIAIDLLKHPLVDFKLDYLSKSINSESFNLTKFILKNYTSELNTYDKRNIWGLYVKTISNFKPLPSTHARVYKHPFPTIDELTYELAKNSNHQELKYAMDKLLSAPENPYTKNARKILWDIYQMAL
jgi:ankyrin repeat protein